MPQEFKLTPIKRFWMMLKPDQKEIRNVYVYAFFNGMVALSLPLGIQSIINLIQGGRISTSWVILVSFVIMGIILSGILQINQLKITEHLQQKIFTRAAFDIAYRMPRIKVEALFNHYAPELMNRFFDVVSIQKGLSKILIDFSTASIQTIFGLLLLSLYHPFFIAFSLIIVLLVYIIFKLTYKIGLETSLKESQNKYKVAHWLEELARTSLSFKLAGKTDLPLERINKQSGAYVESRDDHFKILKNQYTLLIGFKVIVAAGLLIVGSVLVMEQEMNIGQFVAAEIIILLILNSVEKLILSLETIYDVLTSLEKLGQVTDLELEENIGIDVASTELTDGINVDFRNVSFQYPGQNKFVFKDASITIKKGEKLLVSGHADGGKSTFLYLLAGLYKIKEGQVLLNEVPLGNLHPIKLRSNIGDCLMDELLFEGTLLENITMGRKNATHENVIWATKHMGLSEFIKSLPKGLNTVVQSEGKQFSKSIVDKIILTRSIVDKPKLLLIKDVFSSWTFSEKEDIMNFLSSSENKWTLVVVSSDQLMRKKMDRTVEIKDQKFIEFK